ncbi:MAG: malate/lactate/ureidoglycolate dehydrogenase [Pseudomonadota bacterium]|nr:malate/lactate/ureidoglycolate dehydrogenase [Pseudomonadota bacterium]
MAAPAGALQFYRISEEDGTAMLIDHESLRRVTRAILEAGGSTAAEAELVCDHLVEAHLKGHPSHGVGMIPRYYEALHRDELRPNMEISVVTDSGPLLIVDGNRGYGQAVALQATEMAIAKAQKDGFAVLGLRNSCHIGRVGTYGEMCAEAGFASIHFVNVIGRSSIVAPFGGTDSRLSTNPMVFAVPATDKNPPFILDMATSRIAMGKARVAMMKEEDLGDGYVLDADGKPSRDPAVMWADPRGALLPMGEHKGYGLAMVCEFFAGMLTGGGTLQPENQTSDTTTNNMFAVIMDPKRFVEDSYMKHEVDAMIAYAKGSPPADPDAPVLVAGEPERIKRTAMIEDGIEIEENTWEALMDAAESVGLSRQKVAEIQDEGN